MASSDTQGIVPQQVVFIDANVPDLADLLSGLAPGEVAYVLDPSSDGLQQIAGILAANDLSGLSSISLVGHGASGAIELGSGVLDDADLADQAAALAQIGSALAPGGDLQLFACDLASGSAGQQFIADLSAFVGGATVAASTSDIGQTPTGENWTLDATANASGAAATPPAQVSAPFTAAAQVSFSGTLSTLTTELWLAGTSGSLQNIILHADDTGNGSASNVGTLFTPVSSNNPSQADAINGLDILRLDTQNQKYFIATQSQVETKLLEGSLASVLADPTATPTYTTLFSDPNSNPDGTELTGLAVDPTSQQVFFSNGTDFDKVGYGGGSVTTLDNAGIGLEGLALDLPHHVAYFIHSFQVNTTTTTKNGVVFPTQSPPSPLTSQDHVHHNSTTTGAIYETSSLSASSSSVSITELINIPAGTYGALANLLVPGLAVDTTTGTVYFTTESIGGGAKGGIFALNPITKTITEIFRQNGSAGTLNSGILNSISVDDATGKYYVSIIGPGGTGGAIYVGNLTDRDVAPTLFLNMPTYNGGTIDPAPGGMSIDNAPTLALTPVANATFTESATNPASLHNTPVAVLSNATAGNSDNTNLLSAAVSMSGLFTGDTLTFSNNNNITGSYNSSTGVLTFSGLDSFADYDTALESVKFASTSDNPTDYGSDTSRTLSWTVNDGLLNSAAQTSTVTVVGTNDPPVLSNVAASASYTEEGPATTLATAVSITDVDDLDLSSATVSITGAHISNGTFTPFGQATGDLLSANTSGTSISASYNSTTETLTLTGADTLAHYQQVLDHVTYSAGENPTDYGSDTTRTLTWVLKDPSGTANGGSDTSTPVTTTLSVANVDDAPTLSGVATSVSAGLSTLVTLSPSVTVTDPDNLTLASATVAVTGGTFSGDGDVLAATTTGTSISASYDASNETLVLTHVDTIADYEQVLDSVTFIAGGADPTSGGTVPARTVSWVVNDGTLPSGTATTTVSLLDVLSSGQTIFVSAGQTSTGIVVTSGSEVVVLSGGTADTIFVRSSGVEVVDVGGNASGTIVSSGGIQYDGGTASNTVLSGGNQQVFGSAAGTTIDNGGTQDVISGGTASGTTVSSGGIQYDAGTASNTTVSGSGAQIVFGSAASTTIDSGGTQTVVSGGIASGTTVSSGGIQYDNGTASGTTVSNSGTEVVFGSDAGTTIVSGGTQDVISGGTASGTTVSSGGIQYDNGTASGTTLSGGGTQIVFGSAASTTIDSGGTENVEAGGTASGTTVSSGGILYDKGTASGTTVSNSGSQVVFGSAAGTMIDSGGTENVMSGGTASGTAVSSGGFQYDNGTASNTVLSGGTQQVFGTAVSTTIDAGGTQNVVSGATVSDTTVSSGGFLYDAGSAIATTLSGGTAEVFSGGSINGATISSGLLELQSGATAGNSTITFAGGGTLKLDATGAYSFLVAGFGVPDQFDLSLINFASATSGYSGNTQSGTLTVGDGTHSASILLLGNYTAGSFHLNPETGGTGTVVTDPPPMSNGPFQAAGGH